PVTSLRNRTGGLSVSERSAKPRPAWAGAFPFTGLEQLEQAALRGLHERHPLSGREQEHEVAVLGVTDSSGAGQVSDFDAVLVLGERGLAPLNVERVHDVVLTRSAGSGGIPLSGPVAEPHHGCGPIATGTGRSPLGAPGTGHLCMFPSTRPGMLVPGSP